MRVALLMLALALIAGFVSLGRWQLQRGTEKQQMLAEVADALARKSAEPLTAAGDDRSGFAWAAGRGRFLAAPALLLDNQRRGNQVGVRVFGIFQPRSGGPLLIDLGWLPLPGDRRLPEIRLPAGEQRIAGLLAPPPAAGIAMGPDHVVSDHQRWLLTRVDTMALGHALGLALPARVLRLDPASPLGYTRDLEVLANTLPPERHRGYALQWFGLAFAVMVISLFLGLRNKRP